MAENKINKKLLLLISGQSGTGKDWTKDKLEEVLDVKPVKSYTTRQRRNPKEDCYHFIELDDLIKDPHLLNSHLQMFVSETDIYFSTIEQIEPEFHHCLIITPNAVKGIVEAINTHEILYVHISNSGIEGMKKRGDTREMILSRASLDATIRKQFEKTVRKHEKLEEAGLLDFNIVRNSTEAFNICRKAIENA